MINENFGEFVEVWNVAQEMMANGKQLSNAAMKITFRMFTPYSIEVVTAAIYKHIETMKFAPQVSDIRDLLEAGNKPLSAAESWALIPKNEWESAVVTDDMMDAWCIASNLWDRGQYYAAEKSYLAAYDRISKESIIRGRPATWKLSKGTDLCQLKIVVDDGVRLGRLSPDYANRVISTLPILDRENMIKRLGADGTIDGNSVLEHLKIGCSRIPVTSNSAKNSENRKKMIAMQDAAIEEEKAIAQEKKNSLEERRETVISATVEVLSRTLSPRELKTLLAKKMTDYEIPTGLVHEMRIE